MEPDSEVLNQSEESVLQQLGFENLNRLQQQETEQQQQQDYDETHAQPAEPAQQQSHSPSYGSGPA